MEGMADKRGAGRRVKSPVKRGDWKILVSPAANEGLKKIPVFPSKGLARLCEGWRLLSSFLQYSALRRNGVYDGIHAG
jgi:hypothetical protein